MIRFIFECLSMKVGAFRWQINVSQEYLALARSDGVAAENLSQVDCYRQACYFITQEIYNC